MVAALTDALSNTAAPLGCSSSGFFDGFDRPAQADNKIQPRVQPSNQREHDEPIGDCRALALALRLADSFDEFQVKQSLLWTH
jgi:hypothetical protein